jgi:hypothetical protein
MENELNLEVLEKLFNSAETSILYPSNYIHDALYNFNYKKFQMLTANPFIRLIISHYYNTNDFSNFTTNEIIGLEIVIKECHKAER